MLRAKSGLTLTRRPRWKKIQGKPLGILMPLFEPSTSRRRRDGGHPVRF
jgi:hypothetical protein